MDAILSERGRQDLKLPNLLNTLSGVWAILWTYMTDIFLLKLRYSRRKTAVISAAVLLGVIALNVLVYGALGSHRAGQISILIQTAPMLACIFALSGYRDARALFTYFFVVANLHVILASTYILNTLFTPDTYYINFFGRLIGYPLVSWLFLGKIRKPYQYVLEKVTHGWGAFALVAVLFYLMQNLMLNYPSEITTRPADLPAFGLFLVLTPLTFWRMFDALYRQWELYEAREREQLLQIQQDALSHRVEQSKLSEKRLAVWRHDLRHRFLTLRMMLERGETGEALSYVDAAADTLAETTPRRWCENTVMDAMFAAYFALASDAEIRIEADMDVPEEMDIPATELSVVFANAIENAINAVRPLPKARRVIRCECIRRPQFMFCISNPYDGEIRFNDDGQPVALEKNHGFGTASIAAYCEKHGAFCDYELENGWFVLRVVQP